MMQSPLLCMMREEAGVEQSMLSIVLGRTWEPQEESLPGTATCQDVFLSSAGKP